MLELDAPCALPAAFLDLGEIVYGDDPGSIPEDADDLGAAFSPLNPWFAGRAARVFVEPERARAVAFVDPGCIVDGKPTAFFGYWESTGDADANARVMERVVAFARARGAEMLYGPIQFSTAHSYRLRTLVEPGGETFLGEPYNPPRYPAEIEALGFAVRERYVTQLIDGRIAPDVVARRERFLARIVRHGYRIEPLDAATWRRHLPEMYALVEGGFRDAFAYAPMTLAQFIAVAGEGIAKKISPEASLVAYDRSGTLVGFCLVYPHYAPLLVRGAGAARVRSRDLDYAVHGAALRARGPVEIVIKTICVAPSHQRVGLGPALVSVVSARTAGTLGQVYGAMIREDNASRRLTIGTTFEREYALYGRSVA